MPKKVQTDLTAMEMMRQAAVKEFGEAGIHDAVQFFDSVHGIPLDGLLSLQYILGMDVLPLGTSMSLDGKQGSLKSLMAWELVRRLMKSLCGGMCVYLDVEKKTDPAMIRGLFQNDVLLQKYLVAQVPLDRMSQFNRALVHFGDLYQKLCPANDVPLVFLLDSMSALSSDTGIEAMQETGNAADAAGYDDARKAAELTKQMRAWVPTYLHQFPFLLLSINHLKEKVVSEGAASRNANYQPEKVTPGAVHKDFMAAYCIEMAKEKLQQNVSESTVKVWMSSRKAAFAHTGNRICVTMHTTTLNRRYEDGDVLMAAEIEEEKAVRKAIKEAAAPGISAEEIEKAVKDGFRVQRKYVYMDWDASIVELLTRDKKPCSAETLKQIVDIKADGSKYSSNKLGLKEVSAPELGRAIQMVPEIVKDLQDALGITRKRKFLPG